MDNIKHKNLIGKTFNKLTILKIEFYPKNSLKYNNPRNRYYAECKCECGNIKEIRLDSLIKGYTESCGCLMGKGKIDEFSPFRLFISHAITRMKYTKRKEMFCDLDLSYLKYLWEQQNGICPYTGIKMILYPTPQQKRSKSTIQASLDRIDSSKGYVKGNVEFVCLAINYAKNGFSKQEMIDFLFKFKNR